MQSIRDHKRCILSTEGNSYADKLYYKTLIYNQNFAGTMQEFHLWRMKSKEINEYLRMVINIPTVLAREPNCRWIVYNRSSYFMKHNTNIIDAPVREILEQYFDWLKQRNDYVESPEDKIVRIEKERITARANAVRQEIIETLFHPDRCERMMNEYGEVWADIHMPFD